MSNRDTFPDPDSLSERIAELGTVKLTADIPEHLRQNANLTDVPKVEHDLQLAECAPAIEGELLEAQLEEYQ